MPLKPPDAADATAKRGLHYVLAADVEAKSLHFLWYPYIPAGVVTTLEGRGGIGKSYITCAIATAISLGVALPGQKRPMPPQNVLMASAEDDLAYVMKPRLERMGADLTRIALIDEPFVLDERGVSQLSETMRSFAATVVFVDPILSFTPGKLDIYRANEVRALMTPLHNAAAQSGSALVIVRHFGKAHKDAHQDQGNGSVDFTNAARSQLQVYPTLTGPVLVHTKSNYAKPGRALEFQLIEGVENQETGVPDPSRFEWGAFKDYGWMPPRPKTAAQEEKVKEPKNTLGARAAAFLRVALADGPVLSAELLARAADEGFSAVLITRAKRGVAESYKDGAANWVRLLP